MKWRVLKYNSCWLPAGGHKAVPMCMAALRASSARGKTTGWYG